MLSIVLFIAPQEYWKRMETLITWEDTGEGNLYRWGGGAGRLLMWEQGFEIFLKSLWVQMAVTLRVLNIFWIGQRIWRALSKKSNRLEKY